MSDPENEPGLPEPGPRDWCEWRRTARSPHRRNFHRQFTPAIQEGPDLRKFGLISFWIHFIGKKLFSVVYKTEVKTVSADILAIEPTDTYFKDSYKSIIYVFLEIGFALQLDLETSFGLGTEFGFFWK